METWDSDTTIGISTLRIARRSCRYEIVQLTLHLQLLFAHNTLQIIYVLQMLYIFVQYVKGSLSSIREDSN